MKKAIAVMLLGLLFTSTVAAQKRKSDREHDGLIGPVKSVVVETSQLSSKSGK